MRILRQIRDAYVLPGIAFIFGQINQPIIRTGPDNPLLNRRLGQAMNRAVNLLAEILRQPGRAGNYLFVFQIAREIAAIASQVSPSSVDLNTTLPAE